AGIDGECAQAGPEGAPARIEAARAADIEQVEAFAAECIGNEGGERVAQTVATGVAGEPTAPGRRSGGAVSRKRERFLSRSQSARSLSHQISPRFRPNLNRQ